MRINVTPVTTSVLLMQLAVAVPSAAAQPAPPPGTLVRVTAPTVSPVPVTGTIVDTSDRDLVVFQSAAGKTTIPLDAISKLEWSGGRHNQAGSFAKWGAIAGGALGAMVLTDAQFVCKNKLRCAGVGALWGGVSGGMYGALIGVLVRTYDWKEVSVARSRVTVMPMVTPSRGLGVGVVLRP